MFEVKKLNATRSRKGHVQFELLTHLHQGFYATSKNGNSKLKKRTLVITFYFYLQNEYCWKY